MKDFREKVMPKCRTPCTCGARQGQGRASGTSSHITDLQSWKGTEKISSYSNHTNGETEAQGRAMIFLQSHSRARAKDSWLRAVLITLRGWGRGPQKGGLRPGNAGALGRLPRSRA